MERTEKTQKTERYSRLRRTRSMRLALDSATIFVTCSVLRVIF
jgi:hypothetical protein